MIDRGVACVQRRGGRAISPVAVDVPPRTQDKPIVEARGATLHCGPAAKVEGGDV